MRPCSAEQPSGFGSPVSSGVRYQRREPEKSLLHRIVRENLATFLDEAQERYPSGELPGFIRAEFERYLRCGHLCHSFAFSYGQPQAADQRKAPAPKNASAQIN